MRLNNYLGNVNVVISDRKIAHSTSGTTIDYYLADVISAQDYYAFGMPMPGRTYLSSNGYRYGFNGKENDNEVKGNGNQQDYGMRIYDPRLGKFLSVDPLTGKYPFYSPYQFAGNMPIKYVDLDGLEPADYNIGGMASNSFMDGLIGVGRWLDETFSYPVQGTVTKSVNKLEMGSTTNETSVNVSTTSTTSTHFADKLTYIKNNNTNEGDPTPMFSTEVETEVDTENKTTVAWQNGPTKIQVFNATKVNQKNVTTNTIGVTASTVVEGVPVVLKASTSTNSKGTTSGSTTAAIGTTDNNVGINVTSTTQKNGSKSTTLSATGEAGAGSKSASGSAGVDIKTKDPH